MSTRSTFKQKPKTKRHSSKEKSSKKENSDREYKNSPTPPKPSEKNISSIRQQSENDSEEERNSPKNNRQKERRRSERSDISERSYQQDTGSFKFNPISRDISIDAQICIDTQIEKGIMNLVEKDLVKHEKKQYPPRPQSLSFYEDEFSPNEADLTGNLQALSPGERCSLSNRGISPYGSINGNDDIEREQHRKISEAIQIEENTSTSKSNKHKSKRSKTSEQSFGNSREEILPGQKSRKTRKSKYDTTNETPGKKKGKRISDENQSFYNEAYQPNTDIMVALQDLQDDVFEGPARVHGFSEDPTSNYPPPTRSNKIYVQRKNKFEAVPRERIFSYEIERRNEGSSLEPNRFTKLSEITPLELAICAQKSWSPISWLCHGFLGGLALAHLCVITTSNLDELFISYYAHFATIYASTFFVLCVICLMSVFDRYDISHIDWLLVRDFFFYRRSVIVIPIYATTLLLTLVASDTDAQFQYFNATTNTTTLFSSDYQESLNLWSSLSIWRSIGAILGWTIIAFSSKEDLFCENLESMSKYNSEAVQISRSQ